MIRAARADGVSLWISSGYRSNQLQRRLYEDETASYLEKGYPRDNAESMAANAVAVPGTSEHETVSYTHLYHGWKGCRCLEKILACV